jgi:hypothetical protein
MNNWKNPFQGMPLCALGMAPFINCTCTLDRFWAKVRCTHHATRRPSALSICRTFKNPHMKYRDTDVLRGLMLPTCTARAIPKYADPNAKSAALILMVANKKGYHFSLSTTGTLTDDRCANETPDNLLLPFETFVSPSQSLLALFWSTVRGLTTHGDYRRLHMLS